MKTISGPFEVTMKPEPPYDARDGVTFCHLTFDKRFSGPLEATSAGHMVSATSPVEGSAGYVAIERVEGTVDGKRGAFVVQHSGVMTRGAPSLTITIVPDTGTGELRGISGEMAIEILNGDHRYELRYSLGD